jgi:hypothetical protein
MPKFVTANNLQVMLMMTTRYGSITGYLRHGQEPDMNNYEFDYRLSKNEKVMLCNAKPGTWYLTISTSYNTVRGVFIELRGILTGREVVIPTSPPDDTESSGSGGSTNSNSTEEFFI